MISPWISHLHEWWGVQNLEALILLRENILKKVVDMATDNPDYVNNNWIAKKDRKTNQYPRKKWSLQRNEN